jgi:hypothetical protein
MTNSSGQTDAEKRRSRMKRVGIALCILFAAFALISRFLSDYHQNIETGWSWTFRTIGGILLVVAAVELFFEAAASGPSRRLIPWLLAVLTATMIYQPMSPAAYGLGGIGIALVVLEYKRAKSETASSAGERVEEKETVEEPK